MSTADISPAVTPSLQRKTLASSGYKSQRMYCTMGRGKKDDIERKKTRKTEERGKETVRGEERKSMKTEGEEGRKKNRKKTQGEQGE
jgi:hypothetical protein